MSPPLLVILLVHIADNWTKYTLISGTGIFLANIHHLDLAMVSELMLGVALLKLGALYEQKQ